MTDQWEVRRVDPATRIEVARNRTSPSCVGPAKPVRKAVRRGGQVIRPVLFLAEARNLVAKTHRAREIADETRPVAG